MIRAQKVFFALGALTILSSCTGLPRSGPDPRRIESEASVKVSSADKKVGIDYALVDISKSVISNSVKAEKTSMAGGFGGGRGGPPNIVLGTGDIVQATIFEAQAGGLFIPSDAGARPGNYITLPNQTIARDGTISVPYAGKIQAANRSVDAVQVDIAKRLANRAIEPQVVLSITASRSMQASILGDVKEPKKVDISPAGEKILDLISDAGGLSAPGDETNITLQRGGRSVEVAYNTLAEKPRENIYVQPGDTLFVKRERRTFLAFGVTGQSGRYDFDDSNLSLGEALAKAGGLLDDKAEPRAVLLYRVVDKNYLRSLGVDVSRFSGKDVPVVFRANLRDPATFFAIQQFAMQNKDVIYVSTSDAVELVKFLTIVNSVTSSTRDVATTKDTLRN
jgi:polysaccharide export outer membrane protein